MVDDDFKIPNPENINAELNPVRGVTYYKYESILNEEKRNIDVLRSEYLQQFLNDIRNEMIYKRSSQFVNDKLAKTENTRVTN